MTVSPARETGPRLDRDARRLRILLRIMGGLDMVSLLVVVLPHSTIAALHRMVGLGEFPPAPIASYLARNITTMYTVHGLTLWFVSQDVVRYRPLIRLLAWWSVVQGVVLVGIDLAEGLPGWWVAAEGPSLTLLGSLLLRWLPPRVGPSE